jgi:hypothetical protein
MRKSEAFCPTEAKRLVYADVNDAAMRMSEHTFGCALFRARLRLRRISSEKSGHGSCMVLNMNTVES